MKIDSLTRDKLKRYQKAYRILKSALKAIALDEGFCIAHYFNFEPDFCPRCEECVNRIFKKLMRKKK